MEKNAKIFVAGHRGLVGSAIVRRLVEDGYSNIIVRTSRELDLRDQRAVNDFFATYRPDFVFLAAAKVGGIYANTTFPAEFIYDNLAIETNVIFAAHNCQVKKLLFLGSSCIYPKFAPQPLKEEYLLAGDLEPTNEPYAIAKIAGIKMCQAFRRQCGDNFIAVMPTNLYGINDNFDLKTSHVMPALIRKLYEAQKASLLNVTVWGTGTPRREFLYVDDLADACCFLMQQYDEEQIINIGTGQDISISELAALIAGIVGYQGAISYDSTKPDGTPVKLLDVARLEKIGWRARTTLQEGIKKTYNWYSKGVV